MAPEVRAVGAEGREERFASGVFEILSPESKADTQRGPCPHAKASVVAGTAHRRDAPLGSKSFGFDSQLRPDSLDDLG